MAKLLSIVSLILVVALFPPAALAVVSNNAVPGDSTYPIKRSLESIVYGIASINPFTRAWFAQARSERRFAEVTVLMTQGKQIKESLNELVEQTQAAAEQINQVSDPGKKEELINQLSDSITKYDDKLAQLSQTQNLPTPSSSPISSPTPYPTVSPQSSSINRAANFYPIPSPKVSASPTTSKPTPTPIPSASSTTSAPVFAPGNENDEVERARDKLEKIRQGLGKQKEKRNNDGNGVNQPKEQQDNQDGNNLPDREKKENRNSSRERD